MLFKKSFGTLVQESLTNLTYNTEITNTNIGGVTRSMLEIINKNLSEYYDILDINMAMGFLSTAEGYFLDLIGTMFNMQRLSPVLSSASVSDRAQKFYVTSGCLFDRIPTGVIPMGTIVSSQDGLISYKVSADTVFSSGVSDVYVPVTSTSYGSNYNVSRGTLVTHNMPVLDVWTTNETSIINGTDTESDSNYRFRLMNATLAAEKANEIAIRLAALSVNGVADVIIRPYSRGIGTFDVLVVPLEGIATDSLVHSVQNAIDSVKACGIRGTAIKPTIVPVDISVKIIFSNGVTEYRKSELRRLVKNSIQNYIVNIPVGGTFILNELRQQIMDVSPDIKDHIINCYYFRSEPTFLGNVEIYWDEMFYPNPNTPESIVVL